MADNPKNEGGFMSFASKLEGKKNLIKEEKHDYDIYKYFISCVDTYVG